MYKAQFDSNLFGIIFAITTPRAVYADIRHHLPPPFTCLPLLYAPEIAAAPDIALPLRVKLRTVKPYASPEACSAV